MSIADEGHVKCIGRTCMDGNIRWLICSGSGIEFYAKLKRVDITVAGGFAAMKADNEPYYARIAIYVNGDRVIDAWINEAEKTYTAFSSREEENIHIKVIKLSEASASICGIKRISVKDDGEIYPVEKESHKIEIIGDSITCGYGVDDGNKEHHFTTLTEDVTKSYAYLTAEALEADYSIFSISGYGIISGYTDTGVKNTTGIITGYYEKVGFSNDKYNAVKDIDSIPWDFHKFQPELVVINLGTNDDSYCQDDKERQAEFIKRYEEFLKTVRKNNPQAKILCTLGIMGDRLFPSVETAVKNFRKSTGEKEIYTMAFEPQKEEDGYGADWHPSPYTQSKAANRLVSEIQTIMGW